VPESSCLERRGNGKSTLARKITQCFGQWIWVPITLMEDGQIVKLFDSSYHQEIKTSSSGVVKGREHDRRWVKIRRPTVVVGGELTLDNLEIRHDSRTNVSEAPLQLKSNCGTLLIDDFGRQRVAPAELLNRWIVPLENRHDFLTLATGRKIQVPFEQLIIFSTNLEPADLVDEAFLRRIPYKIEISDPDEAEFHYLLRCSPPKWGASTGRTPSSICSPRTIGRVPGPCAVVTPVICSTRFGISASTTISPWRCVPTISTGRPGVTSPWCLRSDKAIDRVRDDSL